MFISQAFAQATDAATPAASLASENPTLLTMAPLLIIFVFFYLLMLRPQSKRMREHQNLVSALKTGDKVITSGGIYGSVVRVENDDVILDIASNVHVRVQRHSIITMQSSTPAANNKK